MDEDSATRFCEQWLSAWTGGANALEGLLAFYSPRALYFDPAQPEGLRGHEALRSHFGKLLRKYPSWRWEAIEVFPTARGFTLKWRLTLDDGREGLGLDIVELTEGLITRNEVYFDPQSVFR